MVSNTRSPVCIIVNLGKGKWACKTRDLCSFILRRELKTLGADSKPEVISLRELICDRERIYLIDVHERGVHDLQGLRRLIFQVWKC